MTSPTEDPKVPETGWQVIEHPLWTSEEPGARTRLFDLIEAEAGPRGRSRGLDAGLVARGRDRGLPPGAP